MRVYLRKLQKFFAVVLSAFVMLTTVACGTENNNEKEDARYALSDAEFSLSQLAGTDALGRTITPTEGFVSDKFVSVFFFVWFGTHTSKVYNIDELLQEYENGIIGNEENPLWAVSGEYYNSQISPNGEFHYWGEPLYGYYDASDPWVIRKQLELLTYAQVDCIILDYTNNVIYKEATKAILDAICELSLYGYKVPKVAFMLSAVVDDHFNQSLQGVYDNYVSVEKYKDCFFVGDAEMNPSGKPLVTGKNVVYDEALASHFWLKTLQWHGMDFDANNFPAMSEEVVQMNHNGFMSVTTEVYSSADNIRDISWCSDPYLYPDLDLMRGRGWTPGDTRNGTDPDKVAAGACFNNQWQNVLADSSVRFVQVQTWNEWWAQKQGNLQKSYHTMKRAVFVDTFNEAFSRDIEPVRGRLGDNYYLQLTDNVRKFKSKGAAQAATHGKITLDITEGFEPWKSVKGNYIDLSCEIMERDYKSVDPTIRYTDGSARNDISRLKMANDEENLYVMVETEKDITAYEQGENGWMNLYIATGAENGWENYNFVINRSPVTGGYTSIEKFHGNSVTDVGAARYYVSGKRIFYAIRLSALGVSSGDQIEVKATDNLQNFGDVNEFYLSGDCAPVGRLNYAFLLA